MLSENRYYPIGIFQRATSQVTIFSVETSQMWNFPRCISQRSEASQAGRALRLGQTWEVAASEMAWEVVSIWKLCIWEVSAFEKYQHVPFKNTLKPVSVLDLSKDGGASLFLFLEWSSLRSSTDNAGNAENLGDNPEASFIWFIITKN